MPGKRHALRVIPEEELLRCPVEGCDLQFGERDRFERHLRVGHFADVGPRGISDAELIRRNAEASRRARPRPALVEDRRAAG